MSGFHYKAYKIDENETTVTYNLCTDFVFDKNDFVNVEIRKEDLSLINFDQIKDLPHFNTSLKPLYWLRAKCTQDRAVFKDELRHLA